ncbi:hypothetical protein [uncultured Victivallis sp.]|uniref:hypothetical protein n=1 Tax=uncultured Victivallis sp. TaxID=354118 RepID=UPI0025FCE16F|nr:hypothetical protein [uncultured Victivallis sp.]
MPARRAAAKQGSLELTASRYPAYLTGMTGLVPAKPFRKPAGTGDPKTTIRKHVILRADLSSEFTVSNTRDSVDMKQDSGQVTLQIWNLSNQPETGMVTLDDGQFVLSIPFAVSWFLSQVALFVCFGLLGTVFGNVIQASRGLISIGIGMLLVRWGLGKLDARISRRMWLRRIAAGILMTAAIILYAVSGA